MSSPSGIGGFRLNLPNIGGELGKSWEGMKRDPIRASAAVLSMGSTEAARSAGEHIIAANTPTPPQMEKTAAAPTGDNPETQAQLEEARRRERGARGRSATIATGGLGVAGQATTSRRTLLGV